METDGTITRMIHQLRSEDRIERDIAAKLIWDRYFRSLLDLARNHLHGKIKRREDEEDILQSMYKSFCLRQQRGGYDDLRGRDELWFLLVKITLNKARNAANRHQRDKRDVNRDLAISGAENWALEQMEATQPSPAEAAVLNESLELRLQTLTEPELREVALDRLGGWTIREIAERRTCTMRTVQRKLERIRDRWNMEA